MDNEGKYAAKLLMRFGLIVLGLLLALFIVASVVSGVSLTNPAILKMFVDIFGISVGIIALLGVAFFAAAIFLMRSPVQKSGSMVVKDGSMKYEYRDENNRIRKKTVNLSNIDKYLNDYKEMNIIDDLKLYKKDKSKKANVMTMFVEQPDGKVLSLKDLYFEDKNEYNRIGAFLDRIAKKDEIDLEFRLRKYVAVDNIINSGREKILVLKDYKRQIKDKDVVNGISEIINDITDMEDDIAAIEDYDKVRKLYDNYLGMMIGILDNFQNLEKYEKRPEELAKAKQQLLQSFKLIDSAFEALKTGKVEEKFEELEADVTTHEQIVKEAVEAVSKN